MENFLGSWGADGSRTDPPRHELELHSQDSEQGKTGKLQAGAGKANPDSLGKEGDANSPWKSGIISQGLVLLFLCRGSCSGISMASPGIPVGRGCVAWELLAAPHPAEFKVGFALLPEFPDPPAAPPLGGGLLLMDLFLIKQFHVEKVVACPAEEWEEERWD